MAMILQHYFIRIARPIRQVVTKPDIGMIKRLSLLQLDKSDDKSDKSDKSNKSYKSYKYRHLIFHDRNNQYFACCLCYGVSTADDNIIYSWKMNNLPGLRWVYIPFIEIKLTDIVVYDDDDSLISIIS